MKRQAMVLVLVLRTAVEAAALTPWAAVFTGTLVPLWLLWAAGLALLAPGLIIRGAPLQARLISLVLGGGVGLVLGLSGAAGLVTATAPTIVFMAVGWRSATTAAYPDDPQQIQGAFTAAIWIFFLGFVVSLLHQPPSPLSLAPAALVIAVAGAASLILARDRELAERTHLAAGRFGLSALASFGLLTVAALTVLSLILSLVASPATVFRLLQPAAAWLIGLFYGLVSGFALPVLGALFSFALRTLHIKGAYKPSYHTPSNLNSKLHRTFLVSQLGQRVEAAVVVVLIILIVAAFVFLLRHLAGRSQSSERGEAEERGVFRMEEEAWEAEGRGRAYPYSPASSRLRRSVQNLIRELGGKKLGPKASETVREWTRAHRGLPEVDQLVSNYEAHRYGQLADPADAEGLVARARRHLQERRRPVPSSDPELGTSPQEPRSDR